MVLLFFDGFHKLIILMYRFRHITLSCPIKNIRKKLKILLTGFELMSLGQHMHPIDT